MRNEIVTFTCCVRENSNLLYSTLRVIKKCSKMQYYNILNWNLIAAKKYENVCFKWKNLFPFSKLCAYSHITGRAYVLVASVFMHPYHSNAVQRKSSLKSLLLETNTNIHPHKNGLLVVKKNSEVSKKIQNFYPVIVVDWHQVVILFRRY